MTRKEFIEEFNLTKTKTKCYFYDGTTKKSRTLYIDNNYGKLFVFYGNDLHVIKPSKDTLYYDGMESLSGYLGAGYSWYH